MLSQDWQSLDDEWRRIDRAEDFLSLIKSRLSPDRVEHSVSVARVMWALAAEVQFDRNQAVTAGLLHDLCREMKNDVMLNSAARYGIPVNPIQKAKPNLLHGRVAAEECRHALGIVDPDIYEAISWHVTGRAPLGFLGQALYFADFSEPLRTHPEAAQARVCLVERGFIPALLFAADAKLAHLRKKGAHVDPPTQAFRAWLETGAAHDAP